MRRFLAAAPLLWAAAHCHAFFGPSCDSKAPYENRTVLVHGGDQTTTLKSAARSCWARGSGVPREIGFRVDLQDANGSTLIPARYNAIIPLSSAWSLVQKDDLDGEAEDDEGWYLYQHGQGEQGGKLPWPRFTVVQAPPGSQRPGMVVAVGDHHDKPPSSGPRAQDMGVVTSLMSAVLPLPGLFGHSMRNPFDFIAASKGERRAVQRYGSNALLVHTAEGTRIYSLTGEALTDNLSRVERLAGGRDAAIPLMRAQHPDLPRVNLMASWMEGQPADQLYLPLGQSGDILALPEGAIGVMWIPGFDKQTNRTITGWAIVYSKGEGYEVAPGLGTLEEVLSRAESLPRYSGMDTGYSRLALKQPDTGEWITVPTSTLRVDGDSVPRPSAAAAWAQYERVVAVRQQAERQRQQQLLAAEEARRQQALAMAQAQERKRQEEAVAHAEREQARYAQLLASKKCNADLRRVLPSLGLDAANSYFNHCGMYSEADFELAKRAGVSSQKITTARGNLDWHQQKQAAERQRIGNLNALTAAMQARPPENHWTQVRVYDRNGMYRGTTTMTRTQAEILGAKPQ